VFGDGRGVPAIQLTKEMQHLQTIRERFLEPGVEAAAFFFAFA
jgi:hypothetical protein